MLVILFTKGQQPYGFDSALCRKAIPPLPVPPNNIMGLRNRENKEEYEREDAYIFTKATFPSLDSTTQRVKDI